MKKHTKNNDRKEMRKGRAGQGWLISKRILSSILCFVLVATLTPSVSFAASSSTSSSTSSTGGIDSSTYASLGINQDVSGETLSTNGTQPYGDDTAGTTVATNVKSELYVNFNGSIHYGWSVLDDLTLNCESNSLVGALGYWKKGQERQTSDNTGLSTSKGALYNGGEHIALGSSITNNNQHITYQYNLTEAFSPNTGKDNYVAQLVVDDDSQVYLQIYNASADSSGKVTNNCVKSSLVCKDEFLGTTGNPNIYNWEYDALYDLAAGDIDNDGYDEIALYAANRIYLYSYKGGSLTKMHDVSVNHVPDSDKKSDTKYKELGCTTVALEFGDIDGDDKDELITVENMPYGSKNIKDDSKAYIYKWGEYDGEHNGNDLGVVQGFSLEIYDNNVGEQGEQKVARAANVAVGDVDGDTYNELIIAGYSSAVNTNSGCDNDRIYYRIVEGKYNSQDGSSTYTASNLRRYILPDGKTFAGTYKAPQETLFPPIAMTCAKTQGTGNKEQVYIGGHLFNVGSDTDNTELVYLTSSNLPGGLVSGYVKDNSTNSAGNKQMWIVNAISGNFDGNEFGKEQIMYTIGLWGSNGNYWFSIGYLNKKGEGSTDQDSSSEYYSAYELVMSDETSYNNYTDRTRSSLYLSLAAVDSDDDSTLMRYKSKSISWTNPEVLAVLQSSPYFQTLEDNDEYSYLNQSETCYGIASAESSSAKVGGSVYAGIYASYEQDVSVFGVKIASFEAEYEMRNTFSYAYESCEEVTIGVTYSADAGDDMAVVYAVPYMDYKYDVWVPGYKIPSGSEYETWIENYLTNAYEGWSEIKDTEEGKNVKEEVKKYLKAGDDVAGSWQPYTLSVPMTPKTVILSVDAYDEIAEASGGRLEKIRGNLISSTPGEPSTYRSISNQPSGYHKIGKEQAITTSQGANITVSRDETTEETHTFDYEYSFEGKVGAGVGGITAGVCAGLGITAGGGWSKSSTTSYSGTVENVSNENYGFNWQFGWREAQLNGNDVLVLEYLVSNVVQPPDPPKNIIVESATSSEITLSWDSVPGASVYRVYQKDENTGELYFIADVPAPVTTFTNEDLAPNTAYSYVIKTITANGRESIEPNAVNATTLQQNKGEFKIVTQPEDASTYLNGNAQFNVEAEYKDADGKSIQLHYKWQYCDWDEKNKEWTAWTDCEDASNTSPTYTVKSVTNNMDGRKYRCQVYQTSKLYLYTQEATLTTTGKAKTTTTLTATKTVNGVTESISNGSTITPSYTETKVQPMKNSDGTPVYEQIPVTVTKKDASGNVLTCEKYKLNKKYLAEDRQDKLIYYYRDSNGNYYERQHEGKDTEDTNLDKFLDVSEDSFYIIYTVIDGTQGRLGANEIYDKSDFSKDETYTSKSEEYTVTENNKEITYCADEKWDRNNSEYSMYFCKDENGNVNYVFRKDKDGIYDTVYSYTYVKATNIGGDYYEYMLDPVTVDDTSKIAYETVTTWRAGEEVTLTATVDTPGNTNKPTGTVVFTIASDSGNSSEIVTATIAADGSTASCKWTPSESGVYTIMATYAGDSNKKNDRYATSSTTSKLIINAVIPGEKKLALSGNDIEYGDTLTMGVNLLEGKADGSYEKRGVSPNSLTITRDGHELSEENAKALASIAGNYISFTPDRAGTYRFTATYREGDSERTASKTITVYKRQLTIRADDIETAPGVVKDLTYQLDGVLEADRATVEGLVSITCSGAELTATTGEYQINVTYTEDPAIKEKYSISCVNGLYSIEEGSVVFTDETTDTHGKVSFQYTTTEGNTYYAESGNVIPVGTELKATATPEEGYKVKTWYVNDSPKYGADGALDTSNEIVVMSNIQASCTIKVEFELEYHKLDFSFNEGSGTVTAKYIKNDGTEGSAFSSGSKLNPLQTVQLTATPADGKAITGWQIVRDGVTEDVKTSDGKSNYTGTTYRISKISADTTVTVLTEAKSDAKISVKIVNASDDASATEEVIFSEEAYVSFNSMKASQNDDGTFTYAGSKHDNVTIEVTLPESLIIDSWTDGTSTVSGSSLSENKRTLELSNLNGDLTYTIKCKAPNKYKVTHSMTLVGKTTPYTYGTLNVYKNGTSNTVESGSEVTQASTLRIVARPNGEGYKLRSLKVDGQEVAFQVEESNENGGAYTINSVSDDVAIEAIFEIRPKVTVNLGGCNGCKGQLYVKNANGGTLKTIGANSNGQTTTGEFYQSYGSKEKITLTFVSDSGYEVDTMKVGNDTLTGTVSTDGKSRIYTFTPDSTNGLTTNYEINVTLKASPKISIDNTVAKGSKCEIKNNEGDSIYVLSGTKGSFEFIAKPDTGYEVDTWKVNNNVVESGVTTDTNSDNQTYKYTPSNNGITSDVTIYVTFKEIEKSDVTYSVKDTNGDADGGFNGSLTLTASRKGYDNSILTDSNGTASIYNDSDVTVNVAPDNGYKLRYLWVDGEDVTEDVKSNVYTLKNLAKGHTIEAEFVEIGKAITYGMFTNGSTTYGTISAQYKATEDAEPIAFASGGSPNTGQVIFTATPNEGYTVYRWNVNGVDQKDANGKYITTNTFTYDITGESSGAEVKVQFTTAEYNVKFFIPEGETIYWSKGTVEYSIEDGETGSFDSAPAGSGVSDDQTRKISVPTGKTLTFSVTPDEGYMIWRMEIDDVNYGDASCALTTVTVPSGRYDHVWIYFVKIPNYTINLDTVGGGSITKDGTAVTNSIEATYGQAVNLVAVPDDEYHYFVGWKKDGVIVSTSTTYSVSPDKPDGYIKVADVNITAVFGETIKNNVYLSNGENGSVKLTFGDGSEYTGTLPALIAAGTKLVFKASPETGYCVNEWSVSCGADVNYTVSDLGKTLTIDKLPAEVRVQATFMPEASALYTVTGPTGATVAYDPSEDVSGTPKAYRYGDATVTVGKDLNLSLISSKLKTLVGDKAKYTVTTNTDGTTVITLTDILGDIDISTAFTEKQTISGGGAGGGAAGGGGGAAGGGGGAIAGGGGGAVVPVVPETTTDNVTNTAEDKATDTAATTTATVKSETKTDSTGTKTTTATVDDTTADKIIEKTVENKSEMVIVDTSSKDAVTETAAGAKTEVSIPAETIAQIAEKTNAEIVIKTDAAEVTLDEKTVETVAAKAGTTGNVKLVVETVAQDENKHQVELKLVSENGNVSEFNGGNVSVTVKINKKLAAKKLTCVYIDDNGIYHKVAGQLNADGTYTFKTTHF